MNCAQVRFLLYAYLDRDLSRAESEALSRHLSECAPCEARSRSARGLVKLLRTQIGRTPAPSRLRLRLQNGGTPEVRPRYAGFAMTAAVLLLMIPTVASVPGRSASAVDVESASAATAASAIRAAAPAVILSHRMTGTLVCLDCEARHEAGLCPLPESHHETGLCAENGEVWRLMPRDPALLSTSSGQTVTLEGVAFPGSGFLRASRVGY